ncbi:transglycosylase family protein [Streptomyces sp. RGM 3693]|uniref:LysM peptidoglycan-binding domain-containing protein n=1 Tax=Streptomyces sp. RGM 3693 TaxID=3413284 RepID=UPI003D2B7D3C
MTGAGLALPLFTAGGAQAADAPTWDRVAQCESGGVWSSATGNGFYGGLQLTQEMWDDYGGSAYASRPDLASRAQQIAVGEAILDDRGPDAFPSCAVHAGLTKGGRKPAVDPGPTSRPTPRPSHGHTGTGDPSDSDPTGDASGSKGDQGEAGPATKTPEPSGSDAGRDSGGDSGSDSGGGSGGDTGTDAGTGTGSGSDSGTDAPDAPPATPGPTDSPSASPAPSGSGAPTGSPSGTPSTSPSDPASPAPSGSTEPGDPATPPATGKHRGAPDGGADAGDDRDGGSGRHASRGGEAPRTPPADSGSYRVRPGDNLSAIADSHDLPGGWPALYHRNQDLIGSDADLIHPGQLLDLGRTQG